jgi:hypothetical protein
MYIYIYLYVYLDTHVPAYGYGKNHGWSRIIRITRHLLPHSLSLLKGIYIYNIYYIYMMMMMMMMIVCLKKQNDIKFIIYYI